MSPEHRQALVDSLNKMHFPREVPWIEVAMRYNINARSFMTLRMARLRYRKALSQTATLDNVLRAAQLFFASYRYRSREEVLTKVWDNNGLTSSNRI